MWRWLLLRLVRQGLEGLEGLEEGLVGRRLLVLVRIRTISLCSRRSKGQAQWSHLARAMADCRFFPFHQVEVQLREQLQLWKRVQVHELPVEALDGVNIAAPVPLVLALDRSFPPCKSSSDQENPPALRDLV